MQSCKKLVLSKDYYVWIWDYELETEHIRQEETDASKWKWCSHIKEKGILLYQKCLPTCSDSHMNLRNHSILCKQGFYSLM